MSDRNDNSLGMVARYLSFALLLPISTLVGYAIGYGLDHLFSTHFLRIVFLALGSAAGFTQLIRSLTKE